MSGAGEGEFERIARLFAPMARRLPGGFDLTDDVGMLPDPPAGTRYIATTDTIVEGVHVLPAAGPERMAEKLLRVNLSDLAAKGARPVAILLNTALPAGLAANWLDRFAAALEADLARFGVGLLGGDSVSTAGPVVMTVTAFGTVTAARMPRRAGARIGDTIWVSGTLGDGALGLRAARGDLDGLPGPARDWLAERYHRPEPRLGLGHAIAPLATAAMDLSDGLPGDLGHICRASGVGAEVALAHLPLSDAVGAAIAADPALARIAWAGGDDYELLFTAPAARADVIRAAAAGAAVPVTAIGRVVAGAGPVFRDAGGHAVTGLGGWTHF